MVDFPAPFGPRKPVMELFPTEKLTLSSAFWAPYCLVISVTSIDKGEKI
jgi:hypothetical protein